MESRKQHLRGHRLYLSIFWGLSAPARSELLKHTRNYIPPETHPNVGCARLLAGGLDGSEGEKKKKSQVSTGVSLSASWSAMARTFLLHHKLLPPWCFYSGFWGKEIMDRLYPLTLGAERSLSSLKLSTPGNLVMEKEPMHCWKTVTEHRETVPTFTAGCNGKRVQPERSLVQCLQLSKTRGNIRPRCCDGQSPLSTWWGHHRSKSLSTPEGVSRLG